MKNWMRSGRGGVGRLKRAAQRSFELRLRFIPQSAYELLLTESNAFFYLNEQVGELNEVFEDFLGHVAWKVNLEAALELAALKVCRDCLEKQAFVNTTTLFSTNTWISQ
ncbi:hypothetical protein ANCDUO_04860 [Ancylostoma duodenale]|uniref:Uncharacterized protein n=1 Tax=Ancylostoma duodenale TaxID=51022 RepID=A0A0C2D5H1_9BILA|nr:hypothetical protein ANCDUO_04860 [Ancylostoma duodenale]